MGCPQTLQDIFVLSNLSLPDILILVFMLFPFSMLFVLIMLYYTATTMPNHQGPRIKTNKIISIINTTLYKGGNIGALEGSVSYKTT